MPFRGILASAVQPSVSRSGASLGILWLLEIPTFDVRLKPFAQPPAVSQNANPKGSSEAAFWLTESGYTKSAIADLGNEVSRIARVI